MRNISELLIFLQDTMSMTDIYQPAVILHLLERDGRSSKTELAHTLSGYDQSVQAYYEKILMRWPKKTLTKHKIVHYDRSRSLFLLNFDVSDATLVEQAKTLCEEKIRAWIDKKSLRRTQTRLEASTRFRVLKAARGKCELCGISSKVAPIDIDHIVPQSQADTFGYVLKDNVRIPVDDERNLQALCYRCNRAKRDQDTTDFRPSPGTLIREQTIDYTVSSGVSATTRKVVGHELREKLFEKLVEEHARLLDEDSTDSMSERIADMMDVLIAIAKVTNYTEEDVLTVMRERREKMGGFDAGIYRIDGVA